MLVSEFIEWLKTQDQGAVVEVIVQSEPALYQAYGKCVAECLDIENDDHIEYTDFRGNGFVKKDSDCFNRRYLTLGSGK
jgi:hypothetical protein